MDKSAKRRLVPSRYMQSIQKNSSQSKDSFENIERGSSQDSSGSSKNSMTNTKVSSPSFRTKVVFSTDHRSTVTGSAKPKKLPNPKMHSTELFSESVLNKTHLDTSSVFSTTVVSGLKCSSTQPQKLLPSLSEISDLSRISSSDQLTPPVSSSVQTPFQNTAKPALESPISEMEFEARYLQHLTWAYLDLHSEEVFEKQMDKGKRQISFLMEMIAKEEQALREDESKLALLTHHERICEWAADLKTRLADLLETSVPIETALKLLSDQIEVKLNQLKLAHIHKPEDCAIYAASLRDVVNEMVDVLYQINQKTSIDQDATKALSCITASLSEEISELTRCELQGEKVASTAIFENSLRISKKSNFEY